ASVRRDVCPMDGAGTAGGARAAAEPTLTDLLPPAHVDVRCGRASLCRDPSPVRRMHPLSADSLPNAGAFSSLRPLDRARSRRIARAFAPRHPLGNRHDYFYTLIKLRSDPLYPGVLAALRGTRAPVLDLGCGLGLLAHALRQDGQAQPYRGVDIDGDKVARGARVAADCCLPNVRLEVMDVGMETPDHSGSVTILDM